MFAKENRGNTLHGILLIALFSFAAFYIAEIPFVRQLSFSPLIVGIVLGMLYANSLRNRLPETWVPGIKFCTKQILRTGIVLYGFRLTLGQVAEVGLPAIVVDLIVVCGTLGLGLLFGKLLGLDRDTTLLTSTGSAICGAAAVLGAEPVVRCEGYKTAIAVSTVVIFGTLSMFLYPVMYRTGMLDGLTDTGVADYTGSTLHEVAQSLEAQLQQLEAQGEQPDVLTFAGNGEPTAHPDFGAIVDDMAALRDRYCPQARLSVLSRLWVRRSMAYCVSAIWLSSASSSSRLAASVTSDCRRASSACCVARRDCVS